MNELPNINNSNKIVKIAKLSLADEVATRLIDVVAMANEGYIEQAWKSLRQTCKWVAGMGLATPAMVKVIME
jgi:hypothetical protein